jgi:hypothetical protein
MFMKKFIKSKNFFFLLLLNFVLLPYFAEAVPAKIGRLWEYVSDPRLAEHTTLRADVINWMRNNFDKDNIPLMSIVRISTLNGTPVYGIDSAYKHSTEYVYMREIA